MPNHCTNQITLVGEPALVASAVEFLRGRDPDYVKTEKEKLFYVKDPEDEKAGPFCFHKVIHVPDEVIEAGFNMAGYDWQCDKWGTKWGAYDFDYDRLGEYEPGKSRHIDYKFDTAWAPPIPVLNALAARFPELRIYFSYGEEFPTRGRGRWVAGKVDAAHTINDEWPKENEFIDSMDWRRLYLAQHGEWVQVLESLLK